MNDLISRQAAIEHLKKRLIETAINNVGLRAPCDSIFADIADNRIETWITELPSAQPAADVVEVAKGKNVYWMAEEGHTEFMCSECKATIGCIEGGAMDGAKFNFCPNCGARMEVEE